MRGEITGARSRRLAHLFLLVTGLTCAACGGPWTARICASNPSGNCSGVTPFPEHYKASSANVVKLVNGLTDVQVRDPSCPNGIGSLDVTVVDRDTLDINVYCLSDKPPPAGGTMTLPAASGTMTLPAAPSAQPAQPSH